MTVTANIPEGAEGAEFLGWSAVRDDGKELDLGDDQTEHFEMPGCNVTVEALYQGGNVDTCQSRAAAAAAMWWPALRLLR